MHFELRVVDSPPPETRRASSSRGGRAKHKGREKSPVLIVRPDDTRSIKSLWAENQKKRKRDSNSKATPGPRANANGSKVPVNPSSQPAVLVASSQPAAEASGRASKRRRTKRKSYAEPDENGLYPTPPTSSSNPPADGDEPVLTGRHAKRYKNNPKWTAREDQILLKAMKHDWTSAAILEELGGENSVRTKSAIRGRRAVLQKQQNASTSNSVIPSSPPVIAASRSKAAAHRADAEGSAGAAAEHEDDDDADAGALPPCEDDVDESVEMPADAEADHESLAAAVDQGEDEDEDGPIPALIRQSQNTVDPCPSVTPGLEVTYEMYEDSALDELSQLFPRETASVGTSSSAPDVDRRTERAASPIVLLPRINRTKLRTPSRANSAASSKAADARPARKSPRRAAPSPRERQAGSPVLSQEAPTSAQRPRGSPRTQQVPDPSQEVPTSGQKERMPSQEVPTSAQKQRAPSPTRDSRDDSANARARFGWSVTHGSPSKARPEANTAGEEPAPGSEYHRKWNLFQGLSWGEIIDLVKTRAKVEGTTIYRAGEDMHIDNLMWKAQGIDDDQLVLDIKALRRIRKRQREEADGIVPAEREVGRLQGLVMLKARDEESADESYGPEDDFGASSAGSAAGTNWNDDMEMMTDHEHEEDEESDDEPLVPDREIYEVQGNADEEEEETQPPRSIKKPSTPRARRQLPNRAPETPEPGPSQRSRGESSRRSSRRTRNAGARRADGMSRRASTHSSVSNRSKHDAVNEMAVDESKKDDGTPTSSDMFQGRWGALLKDAHVPPAPKRQEPSRLYSTGELHNLLDDDDDDEDDAQSSSSSSDDESDGK